MKPGPKLCCRFFGGDGFYFGIPFQLLFFLLLTSSFSTIGRGVTGSHASPSLCVSAGILKFHEVYLGEGLTEGGSEFQEGGTGGVALGSSLEQHIASAREALGVESYYSR